MFNNGTGLPGAANKWFVIERRERDANVDCHIGDSVNTFSSDPGERFEGISLIQVERMTEQMKHLTGGIEKREAALPVKRYVEDGTCRLEVQRHSRIESNGILARGYRFTHYRYKPRSPGQTLAG